MEDEESGIHNSTQPHDFINVHSFSQLPFTRPPLSPHKSPPILRLFGQDFTGAGDNGDNSGAHIQEQEEEENEEEDNNDNKSSNNNRRFECHFCFRNFPTSQALGGHQNAHKRERQLAKRGVSSYLHHSDNYRRYYTPWNSGALPATARFYGGNVSGSGMSTINGNPLGVWRVPSSSTSAFASATASTSVYNSAGAFTTHRNSSSSNLTATQQLVGDSAAQNQTSSYWYGLKPNVQDNVSLDLHL